MAESTSSQVDVTLFEQVRVKFISQGQTDDKHKLTKMKAEGLVLFTQSSCITVNWTDKIIQSVFMKSIAAFPNLSALF